MIDRTNTSLDSGFSEAPSPQRPFPTIRDSNRFYGAAVVTGLATTLAYAVQPGVESEYGQIALAFSGVIGVSATLSLAVCGAVTRAAVYLERMGAADQRVYDALRPTPQAPGGSSGDRD